MTSDARRGDGAPARRRLVAVAYGPRPVASVALVDLAEAASGICDLMWLVDGRRPEVHELSGLMRHFGPVVDIGGLPTDAAAREVGAYRPDGVVTYHDAGMVEVAALAEALHLPFVTPAVAGRLTDKLQQRDALRQAGLQVPRYWSLEGPPIADPLASVPDDVAWPAVLKPRSATGSNNTVLASDRDHARALIQGLGVDAGQMMLEEYLSDHPGWARRPFADYVSVESVVSSGRTNHIAVTGRFPSAEQFRETGFFVPAALDPGEQQAALDLTSQAIAALGVQLGCLHTEIKFTANGPRVLEVNGRIGYGVPAMLQLAADFPMFATSLRVALEEDVSEVGPVACHQLGYRLFLQPPAIAATVRAVDGVDALIDHPGVGSVTIHRGPGRSVDWREGTRAFILAVVGAAKDEDELRDVWRIMTHDVSVSYDDVKTATLPDR
jgi:biotin carboxylase